MTLSKEQKINILTKNIQILSRNSNNKSEAIVDALDKLIDYSPEEAFNLWKSILGDSNVGNNKKLIEMYGIFDKNSPSPIIDFILSETEESKTLVNSEYFKIGGEYVYRYTMSRNSIYNGVIELINSGNYKKLDEYLNILFNLKKQEAYKANLLIAVFHRGTYGRVSTNDAVIELFKKFMSKIKDEKIELEFMSAYIYFNIDNKDTEKAFELWKDVSKNLYFNENDDLIDLFDDFSESMPIKLSEFILEEPGILKDAIKSEYFKLDYIANVLGEMINTNNDKETNEILQMVFSLQIPLNNKKDFLVKVLRDHVNEMSGNVLQIINDCIQIFDDEETEAELITYLIEYM